MFFQSVGVYRYEGEMTDLSFFGSDVKAYLEEASEFLLFFTPQLERVSFQFLYSDIGRVEFLQIFSPDYVIFTPHLKKAHIEYRYQLENINGKMYINFSNPAVGGGLSLRIDAEGNGFYLENNKNIIFAKYR